jgi:hypothetical protein
VNRSHFVTGSSAPFLVSHPKNEIRGKSRAVAFDGLIESLGRNDIKLGEIGIKNDARAADTGQ